jgi:hypothetical protein
MSDFSVIDGGNDPGRFDREVSQQNLETFIIVLLRDLASGEYPYRTIKQFLQFLKHAQESGVSMGPVFDGAIKILNARALDSARAGWVPGAEERGILSAALKVIAESMSTDGFARGRRSQRAQALDRAIEEMVLGSEKRSRENGWSYLANLTERRLGKWLPQPEPANGPRQCRKRHQQPKKPVL